MTSTPGPAATCATWRWWSRVIREVVDTGSSATVEQAVDGSGQRAEIERRRGLRGHFLSRAETLRILRDPSYDGPRREDYQGDLQMHSEWSDGSNTVAELAMACQARERGSA